MQKQLLYSVYELFSAEDFLKVHGKTREGIIEYRGFYLNLKSFKTQPVKI